VPETTAALLDEQTPISFTFVLVAQVKINNQ